MNPKVCRKLQAEEIIQKEKEELRKQEEITKILVPKEFEKVKAYINSPDFAKDVKRIPTTSNLNYGSVNSNQSNACTIYREMCKRYSEYNGFKLEYSRREGVNYRMICGIKISWD